MFRKKKAYVTRVEKGHSHAILKNYMANKLAVVAAVVLILIILGSLLCDVFFDYDTQCLGQNPRIRNQGPSAEHWFGTDNFGRDLFGIPWYLASAVRSCRCCWDAFWARRRRITAASGTQSSCGYWTRSCVFRPCC